MSKSVNTLIEERAGLAKQLSDLIKQEGFDKDVEARSKFDRIDADIISLDDNIKRMERESAVNSATQTRAAALDTPVPESEMHIRALTDFIKFGKDEMKPENRAFMHKLQERAQVVGTTTAGGFTVFEEWEKDLWKVMADFGGALELCDIFPTETGGSFNEIQTDYTAQEGEWLTEVQAKTDLDIVFSKLTWGAHDLSSKGVRFSLNLLQDSAFDIKKELLEVCYRRSAVSLAKKIHSGTGSGQLQGFMAGATLGTTTSTSTGWTYANIVDFVHKLSTAYRTNATLVFNDTTLKALRQMVDSDGRPLWQPSMVSGVPSTIHAIPYRIVNEMADFGTSGNKFMAYGNFKLLRVRRVKNNVLLSDDFPATREREFYLHSRWDSKVRDANAFKYMAHA